MPNSECELVECGLGVCSVDLATEFSPCGVEGFCTVTGECLEIECIVDGDCNGSFVCVDSECVEPPPNTSCNEFCAQGPSAGAPGCQGCIMTNCAGALQYCVDVEVDNGPQCTSCVEWLQGSASNNFCPGTEPAIDALLACACDACAEP